MQERAWPTQGPSSGSPWWEPSIVEERGRGRQGRQAFRHARCKPKAFRLYRMHSNSGSFVFKCSQCGMDGVMLEASGHEAAVVVTQVTEDWP